MFKPGDLVYIKEGALIKRCGTEEEGWAEYTMRGTLISMGGYRLIEDEWGTAKQVVVLVDGVMYATVETQLLTPDQYTDPSRLFPRSPRLAE